MYIIDQNPLLFINPLQVESIRYEEERLVLNADGGSAYAIIKMASGEEFRIDKEKCAGTTIDEAVKKLVFQIDLANGLIIKDDDEEAPAEEEERTG